MWGGLGFYRVQSFLKLWEKNGGSKGFCGSSIGQNPVDKASGLEAEGPWDMSNHEHISEATDQLGARHVSDVCGPLRFRVQGF